jgi:glutamine---fructose-6-phosphate transaminase (isomerizing)
VRVQQLTAVAERIEAQLDAGGPAAGAEQLAELEFTNAALIRCKDALWAIGRDRLRAAEQVASLAPEVPGPAGIAVLFSIHQALSALDRLEVRGRDSAGVEIQLTGHGLDGADPVVAGMVEERADGGFVSGSVRLRGGTLVIVHKAAAEIGELGDNTAAIRRAIHQDALLQAALVSDEVDGLVLGHTRWASIGIISEPNAHPQCSDELDGGGVDGEVGPFVTGVLNGDVDNYADLTAAEGLRIASEITTDAKVIPTIMSRRLASGLSPSEAFLETVAHLEGSVAIAATAADSPGRLHLALRGSGQALYVGLAEDAFIVASEPYGVVEETPTYLRMDGETPSDGEPDR